MKKHVKFISVTLILFISLLTIFSCKKDDDNDEPEQTLDELIIGSWQITDGDYTGTMTFEENYIAKDYFFDNSSSGSALFSIQLTDDNLSMTILSNTGDYEDYNGMGNDYVIHATVSVNENELTLTYNDVDYVYTRVPDEDIIDKNDLLGTWQNIDGNDKDVVSFELSDLAYNKGVNSFTNESDTGAADVLWDVSGDMLLIYYYGIFYGDYESRNEVSFGDDNVMKVTVTDDQLSFITSEGTYVYSKVPDENAYYISDLTETIWQRTSGDYSEILSFNFVDDSQSNNGANSFIDDGAAGSTNDFLWTVCGDLLTVNFRSFVMGDYTAETGISQNDVRTYEISLSEGELTFHIDGDDFVFTPLASEYILERSDIIGEWQMTDGGYNGTLTFIDGLSTDEFTDGAQSGSAEFLWYLNGNMLSMFFDGAMTGDYESYNGTSHHDSYTTLVSVSGNELTIEYDGTTFVYTKVQ